MLLLNVQRDIVWITAPAALFVIAIGSRVLRPRSCRGQSAMRRAYGHCASAARILRGVLHVTQRNLLSTVRSSPTPLCFGSTRVHSRHRRLSWQKSWFQKLVTTHQKKLEKKKRAPRPLSPPLKAARPRPHGGAARDVARHRLRRIRRQVHHCASRRGMRQNHTAHACAPTTAHLSTRAHTCSAISTALARGV